MVSVKKVKGEARRAVKAEANAKEDGMATISPPPHCSMHSSHRQTQAQRNESSKMMSVSAATATARSRCNHGLAPPRRHQQASGTARNDLQVCKWFLQAFVNEFDSTAGDFLAAYHATKEKCAFVWNDPSMMEFVVSFLLACGTSKVLEDNIKIACKYAALASYFEQYIEVEFLHTRAFPNWPKIRELYAADMHTLVSFLKRRIPCSCLDEKYKEVKSIPKIGLCCNPECPLPCGMTERSATMCCSCCRATNYCSRECQVAAWKGHKGECGFYAELKAKFKQSKEKENK